MGDMGSIVLVFPWVNRTTQYIAKCNIGQGKVLWELWALSSYCVLGNGSHGGKKLNECVSSEGMVGTLFSQFLLLP